MNDPIAHSHIEESGARHSRDFRRGRALSVLGALLGLLSVCLSAPTRASEDADVQAQFRLETSGHTAAVNQMFFVTHPRPMLLSVGSDKTVRQWNIDPEQPISAGDPWRYQAEEGQRGQFVCAALHDAEHRSLLAIGESGSDDPAKNDADILIINAQTGDVVKRLTGFPRMVIAVAFNPEGTLLAVIDYHGEIILFKTETWDRVGKPIGGDMIAWVNGSKKDALRCLAFSPNGQLAAGGWNLYVWNVADLLGGKSNRARKALAYINNENQNITCLCWARDPENEGSLLVGDTTGTVQKVSPQNDIVLPPVYDKANLPVRCLAANPQKPQIAIGYDGSDATRGYQIGKFVVQSYQQRNEDPFVSYEHKNPIYALAFSGDGSLLASGDGMGAIFLWKDDKKLRAYIGTGTAIYKINWLSDSRLCWSRQAGDALDDHVFDLKEAVLTQRAPGERPDSPMDRFTLTPQPKGMDICDEQDKTNREHKPCCSLTVEGGNTPQNYYIVGTQRENQIFVASTQGYIQEYDLSNPRKPQATPRRFTGCQGAITCLKVSPDGRFLAAGTSEQIIYLWSLKESGVPSPLLSVYVGQDGEFVEWNPSTGYYEASPHGDSLIAWQFNKGAMQPAEIRTAEECQSTFYQPDKIREMFGTALAPAPPAKTLSQQIRSTPHIAAIEPADSLDPGDIPGSYVTKSPKIKLRIRLSAADPTAQIKFESLAGRARSTKIMSKDPDPAGPSGEIVVPERHDNELLVDANLFAGTNYLTVRAVNKDGKSNKVGLKIYYDAPAEERKGDLYVIAVGTSPEWNKLNYTQDDAKDVADQFRRQARRLYNEVHADFLLTGAEANRDKILNTLDKVAEQTKPNDTLVFFLAGHGGPDEKHPESHEVYYVAYDTTPDKFAETAVPWSMMLEKLSHAGALRRILVIDHCFAGAVGKDIAQTSGNDVSAAQSVPNARRDSAFNSLRRNVTNEHLVVLASSGSEEESLEDPDLHHGVFTRALLDVLTPGQVSNFVNDKGILNMDRLAGLVKLRVQTLVDNMNGKYHRNYRQTPSLNADPEGREILIANVADDKTKANAGN